MKKRYKYIGTKAQANSYDDPKPVIGKVYGENDPIAISTAGEYAESAYCTIKNEWQELRVEIDPDEQRFEVEKAIRTTLIVINKQNIKLVVDKIMNLI